MSPYRPGIGDVVTLAAAACIAYLIADLAHEAVGHGGMCLALGGKLLFVSTTFAACSIHARLIDGAGPVAGILAGGLAWFWLSYARPRSANLCNLLLLIFAFTMFWNVFYLIRSGVTGDGDWAYVIAGLEPAFVWRAAIAVLGVALYILTVQMIVALMEAKLLSSLGVLPASFTAITFGVAVVLSAVAAQFDRRPVAPDLIDRLPSALSAFGLLWAGRSVQRTRRGMRISTPASPAWMIAGFVCAILFLSVLGPGLFLQDPP